jgi:hypothetical protein
VSNKPKIIRPRTKSPSPKKQKTNHKTTNLNKPGFIICVCVSVQVCCSMVFFCGGGL